MPFAESRFRPHASTCLRRHLRIYALKPTRAHAIRWSPLEIQSPQLDSRQSLSQRVTVQDKSAGRSRVQKILSVAKNAGTGLLGMALVVVLIVVPIMYSVGIAEAIKWVS